MAFSNALNNWAPELWAKELQRNWDEKFVMKNVVNRDYEGEIKQAGDTVHIQTIGDVTITAYDSAGTLTYETIDDGTDSMLINQRPAYSFKIGDVDQAQSMIKDGKGKNVVRAGVALDRNVEQYLLSTSVVGDGIDEGIQQILLSSVAATDRADSTAYSLGDRVEPATANGFIYECTTAGTSDSSEPTMPTTVGATVTDNTAVWTNAGYQGFAGTAAAVLSKSNVYSYLVAAKTAMVEQNTWVKGEMSAVIHPRVWELIETSSELTHATDKADEVIRMGFAGTLAGWNIMPSVNIRGAGTAADPYVNVLCNGDCINFAEQFVEGPEAIRLEGTFDTGVRGLLVYGATITERMGFAGIRWETDLG